MSRPVHRTVQARRDRIDAALLCCAIERCSCQHGYQLDAIMLRIDVLLGERLLLVVLPAA